MILTLPKGDAMPSVEYESDKVQVSSCSSGSLNIHPNGNVWATVGILGGTYTDGTAVDMYVTLLIYST